MKTKNWLGIAGICCIPFMACKKDLMDGENMRTVYEKVSSRAVVPQGIIYREDFEGDNPFSTANGLENSGLPYALQFTTPAYQGNRGARFEIRKDQPLVGSSKKVRSEVSIIKGDDKRFTPEMWYSYAVLFPSVGMEYDKERECITQWYEDGSDETTIRVEKERVYLEVCPPKGSSKLNKYDLFRPSIDTPTVVTTGSPLSFVTVPKDTWHVFVFHFIHSKNSDGLIEVWRDGVKIHDIKGRNMHLKYPKWKFGLYKASFLDKSSLRDYRILDFDNILVANKYGRL